MAKLIALYKPPQDPEHFDDYYFNRHIPVAKKIPGLRRYEVSDGPIASPQGPAPLHLVAILSFDSMEAIQAALSSPQGVAAGNDLANFATGGVELLVFDSKEV